MVIKITPLQEKMSVESITEQVENVNIPGHALKPNKVADVSGNESSDEEVQQTGTSVPKTITEKEDIARLYADKINVDPIKKGPKVTKDKANRATVEQVLDPRTMKNIARVIRSGIISRINGCISTGKEANVYHGDHVDPEVSTKEYAIKIYKTAILVFKDRERYVDGEFRFRNTKNQHNSMKMVQVWAEKEFRNLKRLHSCGIPCPEPAVLKSHVLVMEYLTKGKGQPSPKLRDHPFKDVEEIVHYYHQMLFYMRRLYRDCRLVHADLSEYNSIVHNDILYIIDVSQSVEPEHPMSLDFLRMDIKNVNDFFSRKKINVYPERLIFKFIIEENEALEIIDNSDEQLGKFLETIPLKTEADDEIEDEIFRSIHLVRSLNHLEERDFQKFTDGKVDTLTDLLGAEEEEESEEDSEEYDSDDSETDDDSDDEEAKPKKKWVERETTLKGKKHEDKDDKKARKDAAKDAKQEKRKTKMKKHIKKKIISKRKIK